MTLKTLEDVKVLKPMTVLKTRENMNYMNYPWSEVDIRHHFSKLIPLILIYVLF